MMTRQTGEKVSPLETHDVQTCPSCERFLVSQRSFKSQRPSYDTVGIFSFFFSSIFCVCRFLCGDSQVRFFFVICFYVVFYYNFSALNYVILQPLNSISEYCVCHTFASIIKPRCLRRYFCRKLSFVLLHPCSSWWSAPATRRSPCRNGQMDWNVVFICI